MKSGLLSKNFIIVVIGQIVSVLGSAILRFALNLYILDITGRADIFALVIALSTIPGVLFTPIGGAIADRFNRRNLMIIFNFCNSVVVLALIILFNLNLTPIAVITLIMSVLFIVSSIYQPTVQACVPVLVSADMLPSANGVVNGVNALSALLGPVLGGVLYSFFGLETLLSLSCIFFFSAAVMKTFIRIPFTKRDSGKNLISDIIEDMKTGMRYAVKENPKIAKIMLLSAMLNLFMMPFYIIGVPYILRITMQSSEAMYGVGMGIGEFSAILGALLIGTVSKKLRLSKLHIFLFIIAVFMLPMSLAVSPAVLRLGYWPSFSLFFSFGAVIMVLMAIIYIFVLTSIQTETPNEMLGKVMAIIITASQCAAPLGQAMYGITFEIFNESVYIPLLMASAFSALIAFSAKAMLSSQAG